MSVSAFRLPNNTKTASARAKRLFESIQQRFQEQQLRSHEDIRSNLYEAFTEAFTHAGEPTFTGGSLPKDVPRQISHFAPLIEKLADDLWVAYKEAQAIAQTSTASFNFQATVVAMLEGQLKRAGSTLIDVQITNDRFLGPVIVAGDDFNDTSRIDEDVALTLPRADVNPLAGTLTLNRTNSRSVVDLDAVKISVEAPQGYKQRLYEGQLFALLGQAVPEGGRFRFISQRKNQVRKQALSPDLIRRYREYVESQSQAASVTSRPQDGPQKPVSPLEAAELAKQSGMFAGITKDEWEVIASQLYLGADLSHLLPGESVQFGSALDPNQVLIDAGASPDVRFERRKAMLDSNPDTYWQVEYSIPIQPITDFANLVLGTIEDPEQATAAAQAINQHQRDFDALDLNVRITIDLSSPRTMNWIDLVPLLFEGIENLKILGIRSSEDGIEYEDIPPLVTGTSDKGISRTTNSEISPSVGEATLAPASSAFAGRGLWIFAPRAIRFIQLDLQQPVPVITPYQVLNVQLTQTVHRRRSRSSGGRRRRGRTRIYHRTVSLSYAETILATGQESVSDVSGARGFRQGPTTDKKDPLGLHQNSGGRQSGRTTYSSENITKEWLVTKWDRARYGIGIRDLGLWQYTFDESSEIVSIPFKTPGPIRSISLEVDELIPSEFNQNQRIRSWIDYYVSVGDAEDWQIIAPVTSRVVRDLEGGQVPGVIHVNSGIPVSERNPGEAYLDFDHHVDTVRFRAVLRRPAGNVASTPVLRSYRMLMTTQTESR